VERELRLDAAETAEDEEEGWEGVEDPVVEAGLGMFGCRGFGADSV